MRIIVAALVVLALISFYLIMWKLNKKQKLPDGIEESLKTCDSCGENGCGLHPNQRGKNNE
ncbi:MAG: hypothetical protein OCD02_10070 [Spirochaetaceae bacterium]